MKTPKQRDAKRASERSKYSVTRVTERPRSQLGEFLDLMRFWRSREAQTEMMSRDVFASQMGVDVQNLHRMYPSHRSGDRQLPASALLALLDYLSRCGLEVTSDVLREMKRSSFADPKSEAARRLFDWINERLAKEIS